MGSTPAHKCHQQTCCSGCTTQTPHLTQRTCCPLHAKSENVSAPSWRTHHRTHWTLLAKGVIATCANILHQGVELWIGFGIPSAHDRPALILPILCASAIRCFMSRIGIDSTEASTGARHAGKLLSMRRGRNRVPLAWSTTALVT